MHQNLSFTCQSQCVYTFQMRNAQDILALHYHYKLMATSLDLPQALHGHSDCARRMLELQRKMH